MLPLPDNQGGIIGFSAVKPFEMKDDKGKVTVINTFTVISADENGEVYECPIKPNRKSDKTLLSMLLR